MSLPWVKVHVSLLDNETFRALSPEARHTYLTCIPLAGKQDQGDYSGRLFIRGIGSMTVAGISLYTGYSERRQSTALDELVRVGLLERDLTDCLSVARFKEKSAPLSAVSTSRTRAHRQRRFGTDEERSAERSGNAPEAEEEADSNYASLRSAAIDYGSWPTEPEALSSLALVFIARFANCPDPRKAGKYLSPYSSFLAGVRRDGYTIEQVWGACESCWIAGDRMPLWGGTIARVRQYLPNRGAGDVARETGRAAAQRYREAQGL